MVKTHEAEGLKSEFLRLLDEELDEQAYQRFLEQHSALIPREFIQSHGLHLDLVIRKFSWAKDYTADFFYMSKSSADWNLVLVELEKPQSRYFKNEKNELHPGFVSALDRISRWRAWFDNPHNRSQFIERTLAPLRVPLARNPCHVKYVLVHGRKEELEGADSKAGLIRARESADFHIISYDTLAEDLHTKTSLYIGSRKDEIYEIISPEFISDDVFAWVEPASLRVSPLLKASIEANKDRWFWHSPTGGKALSHVLPQLAVISPS